MHFGTFPQLTGTPKALRDKLQGFNTEVWELEIGKPAHW
jgi:hypothetical protein